MLENLRKRVGREEGFTLVELLVVMLILGILAAIAVPSFLSQRDKAQDAEAKAAVRTAQTAAETHGTDNDGDFTDMTATELQTIEPTLNDANGLEVTDAANGSYTVSVTSDKDDSTTFSISREDTGITTRDCDPEGGGCQSGGSW